MMHYSYGSYNKTVGLSKEENRLLDYHRKLAQIYHTADVLGKRMLKEEMIRVKEKYVFLESINNEN